MLDIIVNLANPGKDVSGRRLTILILIRELAMTYQMHVYKVATILIHLKAAFHFRI